MTLNGKTKRSYEKPNIVRFDSENHTKLGFSPQNFQKVLESIDWVSISSLVNEFGSPLFVFSEQTLRQKYRKTYQAFSSRYPHVQFGWSYKTNYLKGICAVFHSEGAIAEVVSEFEYQKARALGVAGKDIIYNGPYKTRDSLVQAAKEGARIHIDNMDEILDLEEIAQQLKKQIPVAIRLNVNCGLQPFWSRFGFNYECGQASDAVKRILSGNRLKIVGVHSHIGTFILDPRIFSTAVAKICAFYRDVEGQSQTRLKYLDIGGGFPSLSHLICVYQPPEIAVPPIDAFAKGITDAIKKAFPDCRLPSLLLETGRHLVDEAGYLITTVVNRKLLPDGRRSYVLDAGVNLLYTSRWYRFNFELESAVEGLAEPSIFYGPLCMNIDVVGDGIPLPPLPRGLRIILSPVGAYNITQSMQFIHCRPAVVLVRENGKVELLKQKESLKTIETGEALPDVALIRKKAA